MVIIKDGKDNLEEYAEMINSRKLPELPDFTEKAKKNIELYKKVTETLSTILEWERFKKRNE